MTIESILRSAQGVSNLAQGALDITGRLAGGSFR